MRIKKKILTGQHDIFRHVLPKCYNPQFIARINRDKDTLPIENGLLINLKDGTTRLRERTDLWSLELKVNRRDPIFINSLKTTYLNEIFTWILKGSHKYYEEGL